LVVGDGYSPATSTDTVKLGGISAREGSMLPIIWYTDTTVPAPENNNIMDTTDQPNTLRNAFNNEVVITADEDSDDVDMDLSDNIKNTGMYDIDLTAELLYTDRQLRNYYTTHTDVINTFIHSIESACSSGHRPVVLAMQLATKIVSAIAKHFNIFNFSNADKQQVREQDVNSQNCCG